MPASGSRRLQRASLVVAQRVDELVLVHVGASLDAELPGALLEVFFRLLFVLGRLTATLARGLAARVGDPGRLLLARPLVTQPLVLLVVLDARPVVLGHAGASLLASGCLLISIVSNPVS